MILTMLYLQFGEYCVIIHCDNTNNKAEKFFQRLLLLYRYGDIFMKFIKRIFSAVLAVTMMFCCAVSAAAAGNLKEISQNTPFKMTVLGDSIAAGYGLDGYVRENEPCYNTASYANKLAEKYGLKADSTYFNDAVSGATTADLLNLLSDTNVSRHVKNSDTILISIGGNDLLHVLLGMLEENAETESGKDNSQQTSPEGSLGSIDPLKIAEILSTLPEKTEEAIEGFETDFEALIVKIREINPEALVVIDTIYDPFEGFEQIPMIDEIAEDAIGKINEIIKNKAAGSDGSERYKVVDVAAAFEGKNKELTNIGDLDIHPNADGHALIFDLLDKEITSHTFTTWVIDPDASSKANEEKVKQAKSYSRVMFGFFFMLIIMITVLFLHSIHNFRNK